MNLHDLIPFFIGHVLEPVNSSEDGLNGATSELTPCLAESQHY